MKHLDDGIKSAHSRLTPKATEPISYLHCPLPVCEQRDKSGYSPHLHLKDIKLGMKCRRCNDEVPSVAYYLLMEPKHSQRLRK